MFVTHSSQCWVTPPNKTRIRPPSPQKMSNKKNEVARAGQHPPTHPHKPTPPHPTCMNAITCGSTARSTGGCPMLCTWEGGKKERTVTDPRRRPPDSLPLGAYAWEAGPKEGGKPGEGRAGASSRRGAGQGVRRHHSPACGWPCLRRSPAPWAAPRSTARTALRSACPARSPGPAAEAGGPRKGGARAEARHTGRAAAKDQKRGSYNNFRPPAEAVHRQGA